MRSPILICGCPGSGTSLVAKILRHSGLFMGLDAGPVDARKYHESQCFMRYNIRFLNETIQFPHAPKSTVQFQHHNACMQVNHVQMAELVDREALLSDYCGDATGPPIEQPWGWKDPRNSATAIIWQEVFPGLRMVVVSRRWRWRSRWKSGGTESGNWYRKQSTAKLRELYENPMGIDQNSLFQVDVDRLVVDADYFGQLLKWCDLSGDPTCGFDQFMTRVGVER